MSEGYRAVPYGWAEAPLSEIADLITKGSTPTTYGHSYKHEGIPFVRVEHLRNGVITRNSISEFIDEMADDVLKRSRLQVDDVLFSLAGTIGRTAIVQACDIPSNTNQAVGIVRGVTRVLLPRFLRELLSSSVSQDRMRAQARGGAMANVSLSDLKALVVLIPPLPEQRRIVAKIEALQARSRKAREALESIPPLLEQFRQSVLAAAFRGDLTADWREQHRDVEPASVLLDRIRAERRRKWEEAELAKFKAKGKVPKDESWREKYVEPEPVDETDLPELPEGWCWTSIEALTMEGPQNGLYVPRTRYGDGTPILRIDDYQIDWCRASSELQQVRIDKATASIYQLRVGDVVVNRVNSPSHLGKSIVITESSIPAVFESNMMRLELANQVTARYCHFFLTSTFGKSLLTKNAKWAVNQASINQGDVVATPIPLAPADEQQEILSSIRRSQESAARAKTDIAESILTLTQLDQSILAKAFRGELVPQDPNDEPASVLLERIRVERADDTNDKPSRGRRKRSGTTAD